MTIICKLCSKPKHPGLFRPSEVRRYLAGNIKSLACCQCHGRNRQLTAKRVQSSVWRETNARFFTANIRQDVAARYADSAVRELHGTAIAEGRTH